ncbi:hypothetical protein BKA62DRAFT_681933 [Auriculariales sp. MPI-PUGE-AT-0066]|nr:hypothetical protein BKA62DRAFT_681933 [Auriculariales sp. MPI-PUGE-AT-0066]
MFQTLTTTMTSCRTRVIILLVTISLLVVLGWFQVRDKGFTSHFLFGEEYPDDPAVAFLRDPPFAFAFGDRMGWEGDPLAEYELKNTANGPVWVRALARSYSHTMLVNYSGATIYKELLTWNRSIPDIADQVDAFKKWFDPAPKRAQWHGTNAVFLVAIGTNDVMLTTAQPSQRMKNLKQSPRTVGHLYKAGARAFVFSSLVPFDRAMAGVNLGTELQAQLKQNIVDYNTILQKAVKSFCEKHHGTFCLLHDTHGLGTKVMDKPNSYGFKEPINFCPAYKESPSVEVNTTALPGCAGPVGDFVWRDALHPSYHFHKIWADDVRSEINKNLDQIAVAYARTPQPARI